MTSGFFVMQQNQSIENMKKQRFVPYIIQQRSILHTANEAVS